MKLKGDDGPGGIRAREENLGWHRAEPMDCMEWHMGRFMGRGREGPGREKHRKAGRRERKCSGGVWAVGAMLASLSSMFQHCRLSSTLIKSSFFCASSFPVQSCLCESGEHSGGSQEEKDKDEESLYPLYFSEKGVRHLVILQLIIFWWWP